MFTLAGKVALVTGSSRGIGRGIALGLAKAGADVVINSLHITENAMQLVESIKEMGRTSIAVQADASREDDVERLFRTITEKFGRLDILVNNAGTSRAETIVETSLQSWNEMIANNLTSTFLCSKYAMEMMMPQRSGRIISNSSVVGHQGALYGHVHYAATKSGQMGFTKTLARTAAPYGITVNAIAPGIIETELLQQTHGDEKVAQLSASVPLGLGTVEDIAAATVFLASDEARYITGITLDVNGGLYLR
ncbi:3-oxoacyl-[acyl-carrier-protein] reductase FabG [Paenibacillus konkukensis]|uniref:3-oxoacyl-[acyl-carrier-protein] reductase FabG n=1 Tax=Paenibacillus konkukensis TaxID=2020716 RepID=A0ABY4RJT8_9BACL|nr:3-oxoacyl-ACP reductase family protein [Paenibacillus konkukensis]UQZ82726.1 3-oxoacyl-[acyl-carrier-protein] reductase FabG [Paenibacillus konkukensis]